MTILHYVLVLDLDHLGLVYICASKNQVLISDPLQTLKAITLLSSKRGHNSLDLEFKDLHLKIHF